MSELSTPEERTEMPTSRRMGQLRRDGQIFHSNDVSVAASMMAGFIMTGLFAEALIEDLKVILQHSYEQIGQPEPLTQQTAEAGIVGIIWLVLPKICTIVVVVALIASLSVLLQTKWNVREKKIKFEFKFMNPIAGVKRMVSIAAFVNLGKGLAKLGLILPIGYYALKKYAPLLVQLMHTSIPEIMSFVSTAILALFWKVMYVLVAIAIFDYAYGYWKWLRMNKMTKEEVKDEAKAIEGDETTKRKFIAKGRARLLQRLNMTVPRADVVVTNPTHFAVALKYERGEMNAPVVVAKGADHLAQQIKKIAREAGVPVLERKALARALYDATEVGTTIPQPLFKAVAEVLAYVYRLKNPYRAAGAR